MARGWLIISVNSLFWGNGYRPCVCPVEDNMDTYDEQKGEIRRFGRHEHGDIVRLITLSHDPSPAHTNISSQCRRDLHHQDYTASIDIELRLHRIDNTARNPRMRRSSNNHHGRLNPHPTSPPPRYTAAPGTGTVLPR